MNSKHIFFSLFLFYVANTFAQPINLLQNEIDKTDRFRTERFEMVQMRSEIATKYFEDASQYFLDQKDTVDYLFCIVHLSDVEKRKGNFNEAFDLLWNALPMAEEINVKKPLIEIYHMLGILYGIYGKNSIALSYTFLAHNLALQNPVMLKEYGTSIVSSYLDMAVRYLEMKRYESALSYLDSCYIVYENEDRLFFVDAVYGQVYLELENYTKAQNYLRGVASYLENTGNGFQAAVYYYQAEINENIGLQNGAIACYQKSLTAIDSLQTHMKLKPQVLEKLSKAYFKNGQCEKAFLAMQQSKVFSDSLFNMQSEHNKVLFEIKDKYREEIIRKEDEISTQKILLESNRKARFRLLLFIGFILVVATISLLALRLRFRMRNMAIEQNANNEKSKAVLEVKNKELTANALQIIEKEQEFKKLLETIKEFDADKYNSLKTKNKKNTKKIWDDFHLRVTQTNDHFYTQLLKLHPTLTPTDLKHCALIKLNFDSKEMSHLLGISLNSVHMARSRIRKKINLKRDESLSNYLAQI